MLCICAGKGSNSKTRRGQKQKDCTPFPLAEPLQSAPAAAAAARQRKEAVTLLRLFACVPREAPSLSLLGHICFIWGILMKEAWCVSNCKSKVYQSVTLNFKIHQKYKMPWSQRKQNISGLICIGTVCEAGCATSARLTHWVQDLRLQHFLSGFLTMM